ncbi:MAG: SDR family oxidoreductase [Bacteroidota bacterium]|nr:SDR family oxidoreductase [Bacteroidota bacterium]
MLQDKRFLITGISDAGSLALHAAKAIVEQGGQVVCAGLGVTPHHTDLSDKARAYLSANETAFRETVKAELGEDTPMLILDATQEDSMADLAMGLADSGLHLDGFLHSIAMDRTIRNKKVKPLLEVTQAEFCDTLGVSAFSLVRITHHLLKTGALRDGSSICSLSYIAAEKVTFHPYRNMSVAKAALERITIELADELGRSRGIRVNSLRFSPYLGSKAGTATLEPSDVEKAESMSPLGNAEPRDLALEIVHLMQPGLRITGEIRHIDGGYHITG